MRYIKGRGIVLVGLALVLMVVGSACDPEDTAGQATVDQIADDLIEEGKTLFAPTDTPVPPTNTPAPPTDTPVPTKVKIGMVDEEGDCEVVSGSIGEDGCQIDLASFYVFPCTENMTAFFEVEIGTLPKVDTWDVCLTINADNDPDTGFYDAPAHGVDYVYCYANEQGEIFFTRFETWGDYTGEIPVPDPWPYVAHNTEGDPVTSPFGMLFPPPDVPDLVLNDPYEVHAVVHFYSNTTGEWIRDIGGPVSVPQCPGP